MLVMGQEFLIMGASTLFAAVVLYLVNFDEHKKRLAELRTTA